MNPKPTTANRARAQGDEGSVLMIAIGFVLLFGLLAGSLLDATTTGLRETGLMHVIAFDTATGKRLWQRQLWSTVKEGVGGHTGSATLVADGERLFALFYTGDVAALDANGNLLWLRALSADYGPIANEFRSAGSSPILCKDVLIFLLENRARYEGNVVFGRADDSQPAALARR